MHRRQCIGPLQSHQDTLHCGQQTIAQARFALQQMRYHFGIGFGSKGIALRFELTPQGFVVFDNTVVYQRQLATRLMWMCIFLAGLAMGGPARVGNTAMSRKWSRREYAL